jgi:hexulose-6-phosphate isomerase
MDGVVNTAFEEHDMIPGISYWSFRDGLAGTHPIADALAEAKRAGFGAIELAVGTQGELTLETSQSQCSALRSAIDASGVAVQTVACGLSWAFNPASEDTGVRDKAVAIHAQALRIAGWLGADAMLMVPGVVRSPIAPAECVRYDRALHRVSDAVTRLIEVAEKSNVDLCLENVWNGLFYSPLEFAGFVDSFGSKRLGVYFDVGNVLGYQQYPPHWVELLGRRIKRVHVKDYRENFGWVGAYSFPALGGGDVPWSETMSALRGIGYDKTLIAEMMPWDPTLLPRTKAGLDWLIQL